MRTARSVYPLAVAVMLLVAAPALGQRARFPTPIPAESVAPSAPYASSPYTPAPSYPPSTPYAPVTPQIPTAPPGSTAPALPVMPGTVGGPPGTYGGNIPPPPSGWDPYAMPGTQSPTVFPQDYYLPGSSYGTVTTVRRFLDELRLDYTFLAARGSKKFGTNDLELSSSFAFPFLYNRDTPLVVTPGFAVHWWEGPVTATTPDNVLIANAPPRMFDAWLDAAWNPQLTDYLGGELAFRIGVYSDFEKVTEESLRYTGRGLVVLSFSPQVQVKAGVWYLDRVRVKILPAGGIVWTPHSDIRFDILFPNPKIARRMTTVGNTEWWFYGRGEYGGGSWAAVPDGVPGGVLDQIDYNDIRVALGFEFDHLSNLSGRFEVGVAFERELILRSTGEKYHPSTTIFLGAGLAY